MLLEERDFGNGCMPAHSLDRPTDRPTGRRHLHTLTLQGPSTDCANQHKTLSIVIQLMARAPKRYCSWWRYTLFGNCALTIAIPMHAMNDDGLG